MLAGFGIDGGWLQVARLSVCALRACAVLLVVVSGSCARRPPAAPSVAQRMWPTADVSEVFQRGASGADWSKANDLIAFNAKGSDGLFHIYTVKPDGTNRQQRASDPRFPATHNRHTRVEPVRSILIAFVAESPAIRATRWVPPPDGVAIPTCGWPPPTARTHGSSPTSHRQITARSFRSHRRPAAGMDRAHRRNQVLIRLASPGSGSSRSPSSTSRRTARRRSPGVRTISPAGDAFNETGGFSADSASLVFTSDFETHDFWKSQIYRLDLGSGTTTRLTKGDSYNEHPRYTPDGQILWMTNADNPSHGTDWWTMNADGSNPQRLSDFNSDGGASGIGRSPVWATTVQTDDWSPDHRYFYGDVETNLLNSDSVIVRASLRCQGS